MEKKNFFQTKEGGLTIAFIAIIIAFAVIMAGLGSVNDTMCLAGFVVIMIAMLYSPFKVYVLNRLGKNK